MMLIWFAFTGLLLGMVSLFLMQEIIRREFGRWVGWGLSAGNRFDQRRHLCGAFPALELLGYFPQSDRLGTYTLSVQDPSLQAIGFTGLFAAFFLFLYYALYVWASLA